MSGFSEDLRTRIVSAVESGMPKAWAACTFFSVSLSSVKRYVNKASRGESLALKKEPGSALKLDDRSPARGSTPRPCARGSLLPRHSCLSWSAVLRADELLGERARTCLRHRRGQRHSRAGRCGERVCRHPVRCIRTPAERRSRRSPPTPHIPANSPSATVRGP